MKGHTDVVKLLVEDGAAMKAEDDVRERYRELQQHTKTHTLVVLNTSWHVQ